MNKKYPKEFLKLLDSITNKRAKIVINHILEHGFITTEDLENKYGYNHPPRAARDVRESGIPLETFRVKSSENRSIAAYRFGDLKKVNKSRLEGRQIFSKELKTQLFLVGDKKCYICNGSFDERYLQIDHRVPYEVSGDNDDLEKLLSDFMLLCGSCNRAKSWSCEHCLNWIDDKNPEICKKCYWGNPINYVHIALREIRRLDIQWEENEVKYFDLLSKEAKKRKIKLPDFIKEIIEKHKKYE
ncbi:MAG: HNH endonuclease [Ignavibacteria bacterium GWB2_35_12]|nr:MAG: HNH endonuclease [Ignavibacteria bacterium GWA2_35_8]OGU42318.1 MAG: HNH endonuclease [Ignavibacteria bacterium GWB2_35_12]OGU96978.1 MAG: HNH endonuclease [Ignavibacteria bacterium RIFOXYA2_FULL_35_10]OGV18546.1 MAG: HNH endonuclease [Ignavibacteria bacterium RIFOXYC2_FULL_35_21]